MDGTIATKPVRGHRAVDHPRVRQVQVRYDRGELFQGLCVAEPRVALAFLEDGRDVPVLVVVARVYKRVLAQSEDLLADGPVERLGIPVLEVCATAVVDHNGVARDYSRRVASVHETAMVGIGVNWGVERLEGQVAHREQPVLGDSDVGAG